MFTVANPLFIYAISLVFDNDAKASVLIRVSYFALGGVAPLVQRVLYVIDNPRVWDWADYLKRYYVFCPIFNLNDAYINISNRKIIALVKKQDPDHFLPYQYECAGEAMQWMTIFLVTSFVVLVMNEIGWFDFLGRPIIDPLQKFVKWGFRKLQRKKKN